MGLTTPDDQFYKGCMQPSMGQFVIKTNYQT